MVAPAPVPVASPTVSSLRRMPELPRKSPRAMVAQTVGLTTITVGYSSPAASGRTVWGELVPMDKVWRTGANETTTIAFDRVVSIGGKALPAGEYSLFTIPGVSSWKVIVNSAPKAWGAYNHDASKDVVVADAAVGDAPARERLTFLFENTTDSSTELVLEWAGKRVTLPITVDSALHAKTDIDKTMELAWRPLYNIGRYHLDNKQYAEAQVAFEKSMAVTANFNNAWFAALSAHEAGNHAAARLHATKAAELGRGGRRIGIGFETWE